VSEFSPEGFARDFQRFLQWTMELDPGDQRESQFARLLAEHFGTDPSSLPVVRESVAAYDQPNLQLALDAYLAEPGREHRLLGFGGAHETMQISLAMLVGGQSGYLHLDAGPVRSTLVELDEGRRLTCVTSGLYLVSAGDQRIALRVGDQEPHGPRSGGLELEVMSPAAEGAEEFVAELRRRMGEHNVYRGKMLELEAENYGGVSVRFLARPATRREDIVLAGELLDVIDLNTIEFARVRDRLVQAGMHLRRGLLLHGPPGNGKTLTAGYLAAQLADRTVVLLTGGALGLIGTACTMARELQPALVILEDIDLVAGERTMMGMGATSLLFELLNQMDGIGEDADVIFLMTTNRADLLEPALAARPGRVDQAVELPLPDAGERRRLLDLFCRRIDASLSRRDDLVARTEGASAAFIRELVRKATLLAAVDSRTTVGDDDFEGALQALDHSGRLTRRILGAEGAGEDAEPHGFDDGGFLR